MMRRLGLICGAAAMLLAAGCGSDGGGDTTNLLSRLVGTWELFSQSTDDGATFEPVDNGFEFSFASDRTWTDSDGNEGTFLLNGDRVTILEQGKDNINARVRLTSNDNRLRFTYYESDRFTDRTGRVSDYRRTSGN